jgi:hypothetical protein
MGRRVLCPGLVPASLGPTANEAVLSPSPRGYVFEGQGPGHWAFAAFADAAGLRRYGAFRRLGTITVRGRIADISAAPATAGIFAGHLLVSWTEDGTLYVTSIHADALSIWRDELRQVAESYRAF